ncbi:CD48 antigen-like [Epinephelus fuscoguttatus]|uniref:CD48 antigen-like n=1 Tax=Epinephelus fuscoguttatus TaxID=293821 RepID=UPI0020D00A44|nr:CD48 antigen-like [Epinephelus fuscoguttatus]
MEVRVIITFIFIAINPSLTEDVKKYLTGTEGGSITLPDPVMVRGFVTFGRIILAMVENKNIEVYEELYKDRLLWESDTGLFTITGLQRNDSGIYNIDSKKGNVFTASYKLTVYESVPTPAVSTLSVSADGCTLLCFVKKAEEATLSWYKDEEILNQTGSVLSLPLTVHSQDFSFSYRCVATNPAENKTRPVDITTLCSDQNNTDNRGNMNTRHYVIGIVIPIMLAVIIFVITWKCLDKNKRTIRQTQDSVSSEPDLYYADIDISEDRRSQVGLQTHPQGRTLPVSSGSADKSNLKTVYDKLEVHRMVPIHTDTDYNV